MIIILDEILTKHLRYDSQTKAIKLMEIYLYICKRYDEDLKYCCDRFSNNNEPEFSDKEIMTVAFHYPFLFLIAIALESIYQLPWIYVSSSGVPHRVCRMLFLAYHL